MKIRECRMGGIWDIGFIDPDKVNVATVENPHYVKDTEELVLTCFKRQSTKKEILLPYNFG
jgi:hypothetical protein